MVSAPFSANFMLPVPEASIPAVALLRATSPLEHNENSTAGIQLLPFALLKENMFTLLSQVTLFAGFDLTHPNFTNGVMEAEMQGVADELKQLLEKKKQESDERQRYETRTRFRSGKIGGFHNEPDMTPDRIAELDRFKAGEINILVASDVAARGLDIKGVSHVFNYDVPVHAEDYVHRIGRTARAGREGEAIAFCAMEETGEFLAIQKLLGTNIYVASGTIWPAIKDDTIARTKPKSNRRRRYRSGGGGNGGGNDGNKGGNRNRRAA